MTRGMMRTAVLGWSFTVVLLGAVLGQNTSYEPDPHWQAPADAAARGNPLAHKPQAAAGVRSSSCVTVPNAMARTELES